MLKPSAWTGIVFGIGLSVIASANGQEAGAHAAMLTALDYAEIQQLYARYAFAYDTAEDNGNAYASLFTPDGSFRFPQGDPRARCPVVPGGRAAECKGREALARLARGTGNKGPLTLSHVTTNVVIEPSPDGAKGKAYLTLPGLGSQSSGMRVAGLYEDVIVKTPDGWRFKLRVYTPLPDRQRRAADASPGRQ